MKTLLDNHTSADTAYIVNDYPYGFKLRCKIRYWIETKKNFGQRLVTQTSNPKKDNLVWNKPKTGNYWDLVVLYLDTEDNNYVKHDSISIKYDADKLENFINEYSEILKSEYHQNTIKSGKFIHLARLKMKELVLANGIESGNIYDVKDKNKTSEIMQEAKLLAMKELNAQ